jgi:transcriptional regulator with XRE-family HTH domain
MHELRRFIEAQMDRLGLTEQAELVRASGLTKQHVSNLVNDDRNRLDAMPSRETITALARAFHVTEDAVMVVAARAYGVPVDEPVVVPTMEGIPSSQLAGELQRRLTREERERDGRESAPTSQDEVALAGNEPTGRKRPPRGRRP